MTDRWKQVAEAERKLEEKAAKRLLKLEKAQLKLARKRERIEHRQPRPEAEAQRRNRRRRRRAGSERSRPRTTAKHRRHRTAKEEAYRQARKRASEKIGFLTHFIIYLSVLALILVSSGNLRATFIVSIAWGIGIVTHYFQTLVAPGLRERMIEDEVGRSVAQGVTQERRAAQTRHERSLEDLSASIAHEIRNPVTAAKTLVQQMGEDPLSSENIDYASVALEELDRVERSISHLLRYARDEEISFEPFEMADVVESSLDSYRDRIDVLGVEVEVQFDTRGPMQGDAERMHRVLLNLVGNALDAVEQGDTPVPRLQIMGGENLAGTEVWVRVRDNGSGIHPDVLDKVFNPFFTTKDKGTGLGLALSKKVVDAHGGSMSVESNSEAGTEFVLTFPKSAGETA
ncbi:MAG: ATP-binding protein [Myxococcota bacterium]|nr:ATP-binding protein [Myxococcota bacterium]